MALDRTWFNALVDDDGSGLTGSVWDKADIANLLNSVDAELARIDQRAGAYCVMRKGVDSAIPHGGWSMIPWEIADADPLAMHIGAGLVRVPAAGIYAVSATMIWQGRSGGARYAAIHMDGAITPPQPRVEGPTTTSNFYQVLVEVIGVAANATFALGVFQDTGTALNVLTGTRLQVHRIA